MYTLGRRTLSYTALTAGLLAWSVVPAVAQMAPTQYVDRTAHYTVALHVGPAEEMISPENARTAKSGEVMAWAPGKMDTPQGAMSGESAMGGTGMSGMPEMDQGMPLNEHLEIHITQNDTGGVVNDVTPILRVTDKLTGASRTLDQTTAMYGVQEGLSDWHYGQNLYLPDGTYLVTALIGADTAQFRDVLVSAGTPMSTGGAGGMSGGMASPSAPTTH